MPRLLIALCLAACAQAQTVKVAPYYSAAAGTQLLTTAATTDTSIDWVAVGQTDRMLMPRGDSIRKVRLYIADRSNISAVYVGICRFSSGSTWTVAQWTPTLGPPVFANEVNTYTLATPLAAHKYDVMCGRIEWTTPHTANLAALSSILLPAISGNGNGVVAENCYYQLNAAKPTTLTTASMTLIPNNGCPVIEAWMTRPDIVAIGDSILQKDDSTADGGTAITWPVGAGSGQSGISIVNYLAGRYSPLTYQDMGWGGQTAVQVQTRFAQDAAALKPTYAVINGGVNDVFLNCSTSTGCTGAEITTIENGLSSMMQAAQTAGIKAFVMLVGPWTGNGSDATNAQMTSIDTLNGQTIANAATYGATVIDQRCVIGQFRSGGSAGNCWDYQSAYMLADGLGVHPNAAGEQAIANLVSLTFKSFQYGGAMQLKGTAGQH
jgi:lysophospholipase L1-like esterase